MDKKFSRDLIYNHKKFYNIPSHIDITKNMILKHWILERKLTIKLIKSNAKNRSQVFRQAYTSLYTKLPFLNKYINEDDDYKKVKKMHYRVWFDLIGKPSKKILEIGAGMGNLVRYLSKIGHNCIGTEITNERGQKFQKNNSKVTWINSDGIHFENYLKPSSIDNAISVQVIEHLHPNDILSHFKGIFTILKKNGKYFFITPHKYSGPYDISRIFYHIEPKGMHLKEYKYHELKRKLIQAGFKKVYAVVRIPPKITQLLKIYLNPRLSNFYLYYLMVIEKILSFLPNQKLKLSIKYNLIILFIPILFYPNIFIVAQK